MKRFAAISTSLLLSARVLTGQATPLDRYIDEGLTGNSTIRQEQANFRSAREALFEARSRFLPDVWLKARYTRADGGRSVTIPVGEMVQESFRESPLGPMLATSTPPDPVTITIMPEKEQETKLQLIQPLFAPGLVANHALQTQLLTAQEKALQAAALTVVRDIRLAYFTCLQAQEALDVYAAAVKRSAAYLETARKLFDAGITSGTSVAVAEAAYAQSVTTGKRGENDFTTACRAFNLLLGQDLDAKPELVAPDSALFRKLLDEPDSAETSANGSNRLERPEIARLEAAAAASRSYIALEKSGFAPTLAAALEGGIIGDRYEISERSLFYTASVLLEWELFSGTGRMRKVRKATAALDGILEQKAEAERQIRFQVEQCLSDLELSRRVCRDSELQVSAAEKNHTAVFKLFQQGVATATELTEAGELLTRAETARTVTRYDLFKQQARLRHATAADTALLAAVNQFPGSTR